MITGEMTELFKRLVASEISAEISELEKIKEFVLTEAVTEREVVLELYKLKTKLSDAIYDLL